MKYFKLIIVLVLVTSCGSKKKIITKKKDDNKTVVVKKEEPKKETKTELKIPASTQDYISKYQDIAVLEMERYKIPASITLAQGILESGSGKGRLAVKANNHFGIKCHGWKGKKIYHDDDKRQECFRKYEDAQQSFEDHSTFLAGRQRYSKLFNLDITDYRGWARELRRAGYATDKRYPEKLISLIERYELYRFDRVQEGENVVLPQHHVVIKGDTLYSISKTYGISVEMLKKWNNLGTSNILSVGDKLIIKQ